MYCSCMYCTDTLTYSMFSCSHALQNWGNESICMYVCKKNPYITADTFIKPI